MKKFFSAVIVAAAVATAFSCSKIEKTAPVPGEVHTVSFNAISPATKTTFGTLSAGKFPTYWTSNDSEVKVAQNFSNGVAAAVSKTSDTNASFSVDFTDDGSGDYTFYAVSPASAVVSGVNDTYYSWNLEIPTTQTSTATGPDEAAMIMAATSSNTTGSFPTNVDLTFKHVTAYVHMNIINLGLDPGDAVASVLVTADAVIAYRYYYYVSGASEGELVASNGQTAITVLTGSTDNIWFACAPMASGTKLTIAVTTANSKVFTKENIITPAALAAGHVASFDVDFTGIVPPSDKIYNLVTSYADLTAGSEVIIAAVGEDFAAGIGTTSSNYISAVSQAKSSGDTKIINPASTVDIFTIEAGGTANTIALNGTNGYLYAKSTSSNYMGIQTTNNVDGYWTPTIVDAGTGEMSLVATGSSNRNHMHYNSGSTRFACYQATSSVTALQALYKLEGSGSGSSLITTTYTVTYNGNGNTGGSAPAAFETTGAFTVAAAGTLEKTGFVFNGWNTAADGSGTPYAAGADAVATADITLYAQWAVAGVTYTKVTGALTSGWYVFGTVTGSTVYAVNNTVGTSWIKYTEVTAKADVITDPADAVVWYYDATAGTIKSKDGTNYIYWTSGNVGCCGTTSYAHTIEETSTSGVYNVKSKAESTRILARNGTSGYRYYAGTQTNSICFFKQD